MAHDVIDDMRRTCVVDRGQDVVEEVQVAALVQGAREGQPGALAAGQGAAPVADRREVTRWEGCNIREQGTGIEDLWGGIDGRSIDENRVGRDLCS